MTGTYEERLARQARLHYLYNDSDFSFISVEEFETWKGELGLPEIDQNKWKMSRKFLDKYFQSILEEYQDGKINLNTFIYLICKAATEKDHALIGGAIFNAFSNNPPSKPRFRITPYLKSYTHFLKWLKQNWDGRLKGTPLQKEIQNELRVLTGQEISGTTIENLLKP